MNFWSKLGKAPKVESRKSEYNPNNNWLIVRKLFNPVCGDHFLIQNSSSGKILMKKMIGTDNEATAKSMVRAFDFRMEMKSKNVLEMKDYDVEVKSELCSQYFYFSVYYAYPEKDLSDLFTERKNAEEDFTHEELLQIFYDVSNGIMNLSKKDENRELGYLQMNKVFWDDDANCYNVIENFLNKKINEIYMTMVLSRNPFAILCPEVLSRDKDTFKNLNRLKVDSFNLGMILLCLGLLIKSGDFYTIKYDKINSELLQKSITKFKQKYHENPLLCTILNDLLIEQNGLRMDLRKIREKYPTQDQVSVFLKSNSIASTEIDNFQRYKKINNSNSINKIAKPYGKANSFQNDVRRSPKTNNPNSYIAKSNQGQLPYNNRKKSLRQQNPGNMLLITNKRKSMDFSKTLPVQSKMRHKHLQKNLSTNLNQFNSPQFTHNQHNNNIRGNQRLPRKQMSMGNPQTRGFNQRNYNNQKMNNHRNVNPNNFNYKLQKGDADFFNS